MSRTQFVRGRSYTRLAALIIVSASATPAWAANEIEEIVDDGFRGDFAGGAIRGREVELEFTWRL